VLPLAQDRIKPAGHAIEVRIYAENPSNDFLPEAGRIKRLAYPQAGRDVRIDTGVAQGDDIGVFYDPMIAKLSVLADTRAAAIARLRDALAQTAVLGLKTNIDFLAALAAHRAFALGTTDTHFIEQHRASLFEQPNNACDAALSTVAAFALIEREAESARRAAASGDPHSPWQLNSGWRLNGESPLILMLSDPLSGITYDLQVSGSRGRYRFTFAGRTLDVRAQTMEADQLYVSIDGRGLRARVLRDGSHYCALVAGARYELFEVEPFAFESAEEIPGGGLTALMPGRIVKILVASGDAVTKGQPLIIMEAMKMEHTIHSPRDGTVERVHYKENDIVQADATLFSFVDESHAQ
jgi:3-methylcrotonyl-CoA carboxylase alpha subunit